MSPWLEPENITQGAPVIGDVAGFQASPAGVGATTDSNFISQALGVASSLVRRAAGGQTISLVANDQILLDAGGRSAILLPEVPVVSVASVTVDGDAWATPDQYRVNTPLGVIESRNRPFPLGAGLVAVTYTHGYDPVPDDVLQVVYQAARRWLDGAASGGPAVASESLGGYAVTYADPGGAYGLSPLEQSIIDDLRPGWVAA